MAVCYLTIGLHPARFTVTNKRMGAPGGQVMLWGLIRMHMVGAPCFNEFSEICQA